MVLRCLSRITTFHTRRKKFVCFAPVSDLIIDIPADAQARHHLMMITALMVQCALEEEQEDAPPFGINEISSPDELWALENKLEAAPAEGPIKLGEREFALLYGCCLLSSRLLLNERGEALMAPLVAHLAATRPEAGIDYTLLRKYVLLHNEQLADRAGKISSQVPSIRAMTAVIEGMTF